MPNKENSPMCEHCENGMPLYRSEHILCSLHGVVKFSYKCNYFIYDQTKRKPQRMPSLQKNDDFNFSID